VADVVWPGCAARVDRGKGTWKRAGSAPEIQGEWSASYGERMGREEVGRLGERRSNARPPGVRQWLASHSTAIAAGRKQTRARGRAFLVRYNKGRLMASYLGQRSMFINWPCPWMSRANQRERETGLEVWRVGGCRCAGVDVVHWFCSWCREKGGGSAPNFAQG
jgi:hypothetical protein